MKTIWSAFSIGIILILLGCHPTPAPNATAQPAKAAPAAAGGQNAVEEQGKYVNSASARLVKLINLGNEAGFKLPHHSFSGGGGWLSSGEDKWVSLYTVRLESTKDYRFLAAGDMDAKVLNLQVCNVDGKVLANDTDNDSQAVLNFTPKQTDRYTIKIRLRSSKGGEQAFCFAMMMERKR
jgi:hypothetical protein